MVSDIFVRSGRVASAAYVFASRGERQRIDPQQAVNLGNHNDPWIVRDRNYDVLRGDARYEKILAVARHEWERFRQQFA